MSIAGNLQKIKQGLPEGVIIVAVSKRKPAEAILEAYETGHRIFGENRVQELVEKQPLLPGDIQWHMVGHLQSNKVKFIAPFVDTIQSVDSFKLLKTIDREASKAGRIISCLLQIHIAREEHKFGFSETEVSDMVQSEEFRELSGVRVAGLMGMATFTGNMEQVRSEFNNLRRIYEELKENVFSGEEGFSELSMGMSGDYTVAVEEGSTMIRVGTLIFGPRNY